VSGKKFSYPVAEMFHSLQGEGVYCGKPMFFIRLAGCNVGRLHTPQSVPSSDAEFPVVHAQCTAHGGAEFTCDTDYHVRDRLTAEQIVSIIPPGVAYACITGGEPFLHRLDSLVGLLFSEGIHVHVETSGTLRFADTLDPEWLEFGNGANRLHIACSPKISASTNQSVLVENAPFVSEWKFLISTARTENYWYRVVSDFLVAYNAHEAPVYLQPINAIDTPDADATARVIRLAKRSGVWSLSPQLHKYLVIR